MLIDDLDYSRIPGVIEPLTSTSTLADVEQLYIDSGRAPFVSEKYQVG